MGSMTSRPKISSSGAYSAPQIVYVQTPAASAAPVTPVITSATTTAESGTSAEPSVSAAQKRSEDLLRRPRGLFGTVATGFRGLLSDSTAAPRKSLLGE